MADRHVTQAVPLWARIVLATVTLCYLYGAAVHVANMLSLTGFNWSEAPAKWRVLDIVYLVVDVIVAAGLAYRRRPAVIAFYAAAVSQLVLYTLLRGWVLDVPAAYQPPGSAQIYLDGLVVFHLVTLALVTAVLLRLKGMRRTAAGAAGGGC